MTMSAFLFLLVKLNLAMGMAVILAALLRRPLRAAFGAPIAYAIWFLVPVAGLAVLLPPPVAAPVAPMPAAPVFFIGHIAPSALHVTEEGVVRAIAALPPAPATQMPDIALLLFAAWALGLVLMAVHLTRLQLRFSAAMRRGEAGPAVLGFLRPRIVTPDSFLTHFTAREQAAILTHERVHLARQDARINALAALLRCLCWFNPLIHLGARWLRLDQELACDASVVAESVSRRDYAEALLKSQIVVASLPLGCNWPGSQHPLIERIALLKRKPPGAVRRLAGVSLVMLTAGFAGLGAWAAQPPVAAKPVAALPRMATLPAASAASVAAPVPKVSDLPAVHANPISRDDGRDASNNVRAVRAVWRAPAHVQMPNAGSIAAQMESAVAALPLISVALNTPKTFTTPSNTGTDDVVVANTPSGVGDPNAIVCRAAQRFAGSDQFGPEACGHNYEWWKLAINGKDLAADGKTLIDKPTVDHPRGEGDPEAVTCRTPVVVSSPQDWVKRYSPAICRTNRFWADVVKNRQFVDLEGEVVKRNPGSFGDICGSCGTGGEPGHDSGYASQSAGTLNNH
jgi:beta-lactamase regulating signal transducer with metallopeptidase domain